MHIQETLLTHISIPTELLEEILRWSWFSLMSIQERNAFKTSVALVSKTWLRVLIRMTCRDLYIPSIPYWAQDREPPTTIGRSPIFHQLLPDVSPSQLCQTITRQMPVLNNAEYIEKFSIQDMLLTFHGLSLMPNLRSLAVEYHHSTFLGKSFTPFCASIVQLHLEYTFPSDCPCWLVEALLDDSTSKTAKNFPWALPELEHISTPVTEDPTKSIIKVLELCPQLRLDEETFTIGIHILSSSRLVPKNCIIFHGAMQSFDACVADYHHDFGQPKTLPRPKTIRGSAPVLVLMKDDKVCEPSIELSNMFRYVHIFYHCGSRFSVND